MDQSLNTDVKELDTDVREFMNEVGIKICRKAGLASTMKAFYLGLDTVSYDNGDFDEIVNELDLARQESSYWEDLWYKKDSWLNSEC